MIQGSKELSKEFPFNHDFNDGTVIGMSRWFFYFSCLLKEILIFLSIGWNQFTIDLNSEYSNIVVGQLHS